MFSTIGQWASGAAAGTIGIAAGIYGGIKASKARKQMNRYLDGQEADNKAWYNANALSDYTQRAESQALLANLRENLAKRAKAQSNMSVVTGATPEQQAVAQEQNNETIANVYNNLGAMGQQWKDRISNQYLARKDNLSAQRMGMMEDKAKNYENLMNSGFNTLTNSFLSIANSGGGGGGMDISSGNMPMKQ